MTGSATYSTLSKSLACLSTPEQETIGLPSAPTEYSLDGLGGPEGTYPLQGAEP
jgi:hypothetical protein